MYEEVPIPNGVNPITSKPVMRVKFDADGNLERYKLRIVARGFVQREGVDYEETFAPTPRMSTNRATLALSAIEDLSLLSVDIRNAFLNGELEEEVYMRQPEGFAEGGSDYVCRLIKSLYGLKQSPRCWHKKLDSVLSKIGFTQVLCDAAMWVWRRDDIHVMNPVFVDDMTLAGTPQHKVDAVVDELEKHFKLRRLGEPTQLLGMEIRRDRSQRKIELSQRRYILDILQGHNFMDCRSVNTPMDPGLVLSKHCDRKLSAEQQYELSRFPYQQATGELLYVAICTRPDIARTVSVLCRYNAAPGWAHVRAVKHLWRYLRTTIDYRLTYMPDPKNTELFTVYADADHGGCPDTGRSTTGFVVKMGTGAISWMSKLQGIVALSTTEAEYIAACSASQELLWLRNLFTEFGYKLDRPSPLRLDNNSAIAVAKNPEHHGRMKHLDLRFYWLRDAVASGKISVSYLSTHEMPADILTKSLSAFKVAASRTMLGVM